ncbi:MAG: alpha/beta hydrolase [Alphaproteobacteria bacterium]|nr:alpha/beta hydrolase [Alphaproteobacteria bacterium]
MDRQHLDAAYNNGAAVVRAPEWRAKWAADSERIRGARHHRLDIRFGATARERLDFYSADRPHAPTLVFIHGGYWQMNDKENFHFIAKGPLAHGINVAIVEYTLAPEADMDRIVAEVRRAVAWLGDHPRELGGDASRLYVTGHSAGGHLTAMAMADPRVKGGMPISGIFELEPIRLCYLNEKLQLDLTQTDRHSPMRHLPARGAPQIVAVGADELPELVRQSKDYAEAWVGKGLPGRYLALAGHDHFSILEELAEPDGLLTKALIELVAA